ncbi:hypothetical protein FNV43_RR00332 [Rhamnella rubrinervis]|uniref:Uncharacterized protein n=1 Tax=Rhamnella rubrinervis TaxID=2594499 RepID=A0A8K0MSA7_9ROSA|nr:hypothetical protein FNV43_RR00332 [Rhamnella rubrinervis]
MNKISTPKTINADIESGGFLAKALSTSEEHPTAEIPTTITERPPTFDDVEKGHNFQKLQVRLVIYLPVQLLKEVGVAHGCVAMVLHEGQIHGLAPCFLHQGTALKIGSQIGLVHKNFINSRSVVAHRFLQLRVDIPALSFWESLGCRLDSWKGDSISDLISSSLNPMAKLLVDGLTLVEEFLATTYKNFQSPNPSLASGSQVWCPPEQGFIKAAHCGWRDVEWEADAKEVEKVVSAKDEPSCWYVYVTICSIRECFGNQGWKVIRKSRSYNLVADAVAKLSLSSSRELVLMNSL